MKELVIFGATSAIAVEAAKCFAKDGVRLVLVGRDEAKLAALSNDLDARGAASTHCLQYDLADISKHQKLLEEVTSLLPQCDGVLIAHGILGDEALCQKDFLAALEVYNVNFLSAVSLLTRFASFFEERKAGVLGVITSVAGDRGRKGNYVYGSSKGALSIYLSGLRGRLVDSGVSVTDIRPGFVDTPMTADFKKGPLFASAKIVGSGVYAAMKAGKDIVYLPWFWRLIMMVIQSIPEKLFKKTNI